MKKLILFFIIITGANYANAQQGLRPAKPQLFEGQAWPQPFLTDSLLKIKPGNKDRLFFTEKQGIRTDAPVNFYSRMPVIKPAKGNSRMPVLDLNRDNTLYNMPIAKVNIINPDTVGVEKAIP